MRLTRLLGRVPVLGWVVAGLVVAGLVAWPLGGWDTVRLVSREVPSFDEGETLEGHRFDLTLGSLRLSDTHPAGYEADPETNEIYLILDVEVVNVTDESTSPAPLGSVIVPDDPRFAELNENYVLDDGTSGPELNPGLPRHVEVVWTVDDRDFADGDEIAFRLRDSIPRKAILFRGITWGDYFEAGAAERVIGA